MGIKTKFKLLQYVWIMRNDRPVKVRIEKIDVLLRPEYNYETKGYNAHSCATYKLSDGMQVLDGWFDEDKLFVTKSSLFRYLDKLN